MLQSAILGGVTSMNRREFIGTVGAAAAVGAACAPGSEPGEPAEATTPDAAIALPDFEPRSMLHVAETRVERPRFPVIDVHTHVTWSDVPLGVEPFGERIRKLSEPAALLPVMDRKGVRTMVNLTGGVGAGLADARREFDEAYPGRFTTRDSRLGSRSVLLADRSVQRTLRGVARASGLVVPRAGLPESHRAAGGAGPCPGASPRTTFIGLHVGHWAENLAAVGETLDRFPNLHVEIGARIGELGRQPRAARRFFEAYQDRILFGTDAIPAPEGDATPQQIFGDALYEIYYRFLETEDEYFDYAPARVPPQGRWRISGLGLPETILRKVYHANAERVLGIAV